MAKKDENSQKSALGKGLAEVLARQDGPGQQPEAPPPEEEAKDAKTLAQEFLLSAEGRIRAISGTDLDITDVEIEYLQARTAFAVGNFEGTLDYLEKINEVMEELEKEADEQKAAAAAEAPPPPDDEEEETPPPPPDSEETVKGEEGVPTDGETGEALESGEEEDEEEEEVLPEDKSKIFCMMCGEQITDDSKFCNWCGEKVD